MTSQQQEDDAPPRTPVSLESSSLLLLSPPMLHREEKDGNKECWNNDQEDDMMKEHLGASQVPSFPIMGRATLPQHSMDIDTNESSNTRTRRLINPGKRRSCSFDDLLPVPNVFLRPRYRRDTETFERLTRQENSSTCAGRENGLKNRKRSHHVRSYTFDGTVDINMFDGFPAHINSPPPNTPSFATSYLGQAQQSTSQFSPLGNCSTESPRFAQNLARPIPRHSTLSTTTVSSSTTTNGVGTICSSSTSAFETASSSFAKSRTSSVRTSSPCDVSGSEESLRDSGLAKNGKQTPVISTSHQSFDTSSFHKKLRSPPFDGTDGRDGGTIDGGTLPFSEVRVMGDELLNDVIYDSPNSNGSDCCIENLTSLSLISSERPSHVQPQSCSERCLKSP